MKLGGGDEGRVGGGSRKVNGRLERLTKGCRKVRETAYHRLEARQRIEHGVGSSALG